MKKIAILIFTALGILFLGSCNKFDPDDYIFYVIDVEESFVNKYPNCTLYLYVCNDGMHVGSPEIISKPKAGYHKMFHADESANMLKIAVYTRQAVPQWVGAKFTLEKGNTKQVKLTGQTNLVDTEPY